MKLLTSVVQVQAQRPGPSEALNAVGRYNDMKRVRWRRGALRFGVTASKLWYIWNDGCLSKSVLPRDDAVEGYGGRDRGARAYRRFEDDMRLNVRW
jgi:hypothetical protein